MKPIAYIKPCTYLLLKSLRHCGLGLMLMAPAYVSAAEHATIVLYHHISTSTPESTSVPPDKFREQMEYLRSDGYNVMALPELLTALQNRQQLPDKTVAITFDDGYSSIFDTAFPLLQEYGFPFTVFINTQPINDHLKGYMTWTQIKAMADADVTIANHMVNHPHMTDGALNESDTDRVTRFRAELLQAQTEIEQQTGQDHRFMAYPYGEYDIAVKDMLAEVGFIGLGQQSGAVGFDSDFLALPRFPFGGSYTDFNDFKQKVQTLAFHVLEVDPETPITTETNPSVTLQFAPGNFNFRQIGCFAGSQPMQMDWLNQEEGRVRITPAQTFNSRRFRYLCTAPDRDLRGRFYWYSKDWTRSTPTNQD